jgi:hypothetical protein
VSRAQHILAVIVGLITGVLLVESYGAMVTAARAGGRAIPELWPLGTEALALAMEVSVLEAKRLGHRAVLYRVEVLVADDGQDLDPAAAELSPSRQWVLAALQAGGELQTVKQLGDRLAEIGRPLKPRTIQTALGELEAAGLAAGSEEGNGRARYWSPATPNPGTDGGEDEPGHHGGEPTHGPAANRLV